MTRINQSIENRVAIAELVYPISLLAWWTFIIGIFFVIKGDIPIDNIPNGVYITVFILLTWLPAYIYLFFYPKSKVNDKLAIVLRSQSHVYARTKVNWFDIYRDHFGATLLIAAFTGFIISKFTMFLSTTPSLPVLIFFSPILFICLMGGFFIYFIPLARVIGLMKWKVKVSNHLKLTILLVVSLLDYFIFDFAVKLSIQQTN